MIEGQQRAAGNDIWLRSLGCNKHTCMYRQKHTGMYRHTHSQESAGMAARFSVFYFFGGQPGSSAVTYTVREVKVVLLCA